MSFYASEEKIDLAMAERLVIEYINDHCDDRPMFGAAEVLRQQGYPDSTHNRFRVLRVLDDICVVERQTSRKLYKMPDDVPECGDFFGVDSP